MLKKWKKSLELYAVILNVIRTLFLLDCKIRGGAQKGIHFTSTTDGRPSGEAFVELTTPEDVERLDVIEQILKCENKV